MVEYTSPLIVPPTGCAPLPSSVVAGDEISPEEESRCHITTYRVVVHGLGGRTGRNAFKENRGGGGGSPLACVLP